MTETPRASRADGLARGFVAIYAAVHTLAAFLPDWWSPNRFDGDHHQHVWWTARFTDPSLFPDDFIADFFSLPLFAPVGWQSLMRLGAQIADPQRVAETIPLLLGPLMFALAWRAGREVGGGWVGGVLAASIVPALFSPMEGGLPRSFGQAILLLSVVALLERRLAWLGVAGVAAVLFYPPVVVNLGLTAAVVLGADALRERRLPAGWPPLAACAALALGILLWVYATPIPDDVGPKIGGAEAATLPEFGPEGRSRLFEPDPVEQYFGNGRGGYGIDPKVSLGIGAVLATSLAVAPRLLPLPVWALLGTGLLAHAVAWATLFALHLPNRYMRHALPVFLVLFLAAAGGRLAALAARRFPALSNPRLVVAAGAAFLAVDGGRTLYGMAREIRAPIYTARVDMHAFVATLPKDALVAAHPDVANSIPLRSRRSVLISKEVALPYYRGFYQRAEERVEASLRAHYAYTWDEVEVLHERYGVDVFVVHGVSFRRPPHDFEEPFGSRLGDRLDQPRERYVLSDPPDDRVLYHNGSYWVVRLGPPRPGYASRAAE